MLLELMLKTAHSINFTLDFAPKVPSPQLFPLFTWKNYALNHFGYKFKGDLFPTQDVSHQPLQAVIQQIYPRLSFGELSTLFLNLKVTELDLNFEALFSFYQYRFDARLEKMLMVYQELPLDFQAWGIAHEISPRDLAPLVSLPEISAANDVLKTIAHYKFSRSQASFILELAVELLLMDYTWDDMAPPAEKQGMWIEKWFLQLKDLRFPVTAQIDSTQQDLLARLPWSKDFNTRWSRTGDKSGLEVKFLLTSKGDLEKKMQALKRIHESWED